MESVTEKNGIDPSRASASLVSVIVPVYNAAPYLEECLDSITGQTYENIEIICVDDGSTDDSGRILQEYDSKDDRITVIHCDHADAGHARNVGLERAKGDYLAFLDADDFFDSTMIEKLVTLADEHDLDIAMCRVNEFNDKKKTTRKRANAALDELVPGKLYSADDLWGYAFRYAVGWPWDKLFRRSFIERHGLEFQELGSSNDAFFVFTALALMKRFMFTEERLATHRIANENSIEHSRDRQWKNCFIALEAVRDRFHQEGIMDKARKDFNCWLANTCIWNLNKLEEAKRPFFDYVKENYIEELSDADPQDYRWGDMVDWRMNIWDVCDYDLALTSFGVRRESNALRHEAKVLQRRADARKETIGKLRDRIDKKDERIADLRERVFILREQKREALDELERVRSSTSFKLGHALTSPFRKIKKMVKHL